MTNRTCAIVLATMGVTLLAGLSGCTIHPRGERAQRLAATDAGKAFEKRIDQRELAPLPADVSPDQMVKYALLANAELEQRYWEWRSAIEQIPQDGTQSGLVLYAGVPITHGSTAFNRTTITVASDPMKDIVWPTKLSTAAHMALEKARAAGLRFQKARYDLRSKVLSAYYDYTLIAELIRLEQTNATLLTSIATITEARNGAGMSGQRDLLKARNEVDLSRNEIARMQSELISQRAILNALLSRDPAAALACPDELPVRRELQYTDAQLLHRAAVRNPELRALAREIGSRKDGIKLAKLQYFPDFSISANTNLSGTVQDLMGMVTLPLLRREAIDAAIAQAQSDLRKTEAMRRRTSNDLAAQIVLDIATLRDSDRQLKLFDETILPRARRVVEVVRGSYEVGQTTFLDFLDSQRSLIAIERLVANLRVMREKQLVDIEAITAVNLDH
jgi:outer membrane protein TolC